MNQLAMVFPLNPLRLKISMWKKKKELPTILVSYPKFCLS